MASKQRSKVELVLDKFSLKCLKCNNFWNVSKYSWEVRCPKCSHLMVKAGGNAYCSCSHQRKLHSRPDCGGCYECECMLFENVKEHISKKDEVKFFNHFCISQNTAT